jgi:transposase
MPPSLRDWVPEDHLVWTVLEAVEEMDLSDFYADYRDDGHGRPAYDPKMMVALLLYAYAKGDRSSRGIERKCQEDVAYRVICANHVPDHSTIAEFRRRHETALSELFTSVLSLCQKAGLGRVGVIAIDGTKIAANASLDANRGYEWIVREILKEAEETDRREDERHGDARGDELPEQLRTREGRRAALREAKRKLEAEQESPEPASQPAAEPPLLQGRAIGQGRRGWLREGRRQLDQRRAQQARPISRSREARLLESKRRLEEDLEAERSANEAYEAYRSRGVMRDGRRSVESRGRQSPTNRRPPRPGRSTPPTTTRGSSARRASPRPRATTRRRRSQRIRSSSPPRSPSNRPTSATSNRWSRRPPASSKGRARGLTADRRRRPGLLAHEADGERRQPWDPGPDPARLRRSQGHPAGVGQGHLCLHATGASDRPRAGDLPTADGDCRAGDRPDEVQPRLHPLSATRKIGRALGVAIGRGDPQPAEAPHSPSSRRAGLTIPRPTPPPPATNGEGSAVSRSHRNVFPTATCRSESPGCFVCVP